jgi:hypothetical protein
MIGQVLAVAVRPRPLGIDNHNKGGPAVDRAARCVAGCRGLGDDGSLFSQGATMAHANCRHSDPKAVTVETMKSEVLAAGRCRHNLRLRGPCDLDQNKRCGSLGKFPENS